jgi:hypothetical protein
VAQGQAQGKGPDETSDDLEYFKLRPEGELPGAPRYAVEPENWPAVRAFLAVQSQFRRTGLRYEGVYWGLRMKGIRCTPDLFQRLQMIEAGALTALAEETAHD